MSTLNYLERLLDGGAVDWKTLGEISLKSYSGGTPKAGNSRYYDGGTIPWLRTQEVVFSDVWDTAVKITQEALDETAAKWVPKNCVIIAISGATAGRSGINKIPLATNQHCCCLEIDPAQAFYRYVYHWVEMNYAKLRGLGQGARGDLNSGIIKNYRIPIPCPEDPSKSLSIQTEIVQILDRFTEMKAELIAELIAEHTARKQQYNHYRDRLLSFKDGDVEWKTLEAVADFQNAKPHEKLVAQDGDVALLTAGFISTDGKSARFVRKAEVLTPAFKNDVAMVMSDLPNGRALARTFFVEEDGRYAANQRVCLLRAKEPASLSPRFLNYVMNRNKQLLRYDSGYDQTHLKKDWILDVKIPVLPMIEQARIVAILDKFDTLTTSLSEGLPREIKLRQQQYEYYRDLLLSFPKPEEAA